MPNRSDDKNSNRNESNSDVISVEMNKQQSTSQSNGGGDDNAVLDSNPKAPSHLSDTSTLDRETIVSKNKDTNTDQVTAYEKRRSNWLKYHLLGDIYADDDPSDMSERRQNIIILVVALGGVAGPLGSMMFMPGLLAVANDLNTSTSAVNGSVSAYVVFMGVAPLIWASISDQYGRKRMYLFSNLLSLVTSIICAVSSNIGMLIVFRGLQSCGANAGLTLGAGVIADTIPISIRGKAYGWFYIGPLIGPVLGPTIGGFLCQYLGWRSTFYFQAILSGLLLIMTTAFLPETLRKAKPEENLSSEKTSSHPGVLQKLVRDFKPMFLMLRDWSIISITVYHTVIFACLYFLNPTITSTFHALYGYNEWQVGLCYLSLGFGLMIGSVISGRHSDSALNNTKKTKRHTRQVPEMRLMASVPAFFFIPAGYIIYGWTAEKGVGVYAPLIGLFVYALGQMWAFTPTSVYLVDSKPGSSATAVGVTNAVRSIVGAVTAVFSTDAVDALGPGILFTILAAINIVNFIFVLLTYYYGEAWRTNFETNVLHRPPSDSKAFTATDDIEAAAVKGNSNIASTTADEQHMGDLHLARITSKHSAV
ncbi:major facilitator superfamily domain-containing protein [Zychaea mexicana]|uniref:major facilitator superfamily domain-containing protein n=1 Tax=Zychaea mexicana TaxID=64656 RepID=UPI0022FF06E1|nr:major facilitator superfamily domain-containing protein [Zychaea mexicana]KAI9491754.1 major facilitator superfamily domain-containing protein [Zychaea mexicana]